MVLRQYSDQWRLALAVLLIPSKSPVPFYVQYQVNLKGFMLKYLHVKNIFRSINHLAIHKRAT